MYVKKGQKIGIREMEQQDCMKIVEWRNKGRVRSHYIYREDFTLESERQYFREQVLTGNVFQYMICELDNSGRAVGSAVFKDYRPTERQIEYGLFIGEDDTIGKGYGQEATSLCLELGFEKFDVDRIIGTIFCDNIPSLVSNIKAGMLPSAILKDVECTDGTVKDMVLVEARRGES